MSIRPLEVLFRENDLDDHDVDAVVARFERIREELPLLSRSTTAEGELSFVGPGGIEAEVRSDRGRTLLRYRSAENGRLFRTWFELPREDTLIESVRNHGLGAYVDRVEHALRTARGGTPSSHHVVSETFGIGATAAKSLDAVVDASLHVIASVNPRFPRHRAVIVRSPCLGHPGSILDDKGRPLLAASVEQAFLSRAVPCGVLCRDRGSNDIRPVEARGIMRDGHADPISVLRSWAGLGLDPMQGRLLRKAGLATS